MYIHSPIHSPLHISPLPLFQISFFLLFVVCLASTTKVQGMMEVNGRSFHCNQRKSLDSTPANEQKKPAENSQSTPVFINHAAMAWNESRRKWIGDVSQRSERRQKDPIISWSTTYEDLLSTNDPFPEPIPLPEMLDFLVDIWHDEGLYD